MSDRLPRPGPLQRLGQPSRSTAAVEHLTDEQFRADRGVFFKSLHGTLNHLLVTDRIWMGRFTGQPEAGLRLDAILFDDFDALQTARQAEDTRIISYVDGLDDAALAGSFSYPRATTPSDTQPNSAPPSITCSITRPIIAAGPRDPHRLRRGSAVARSQLLSSARSASAD